MATLIALAGDEGPLSRFDPQLADEQQELRLLYVSAKLAGWLATTLPTLGSQWNLDMTPAEQLDDMLAVYASGDVLTYDLQFKPISNLGEGVWELKTADVRVFGWFHAKDCFVGVVADEAWRVKTHRLVPGYRGEVVRYRNALALDAPKFVPGEDPNAVVSNYAEA